MQWAILLYSLKRLPWSVARHSKKSLVCWVLFNTAVCSQEPQFAYLVTSTFPQPAAAEWLNPQGPWCTSLRPSALLPSHVLLTYLCIAVVNKTCVDSPADRLSLTGPMLLLAMLFQCPRSLRRHPRLLQHIALLVSIPLIFTKFRTLITVTTTINSLLS